MENECDTFFFFFYTTLCDTLYVHVFDLFECMTKRGDSPKKNVLKIIANLNFLVTSKVFIYLFMFKETFDRTLKSTYQYIQFLKFLKKKNRTERYFALTEGTLLSGVKFTF